MRSLWTYQDIASEARVHPRTVQRWVKRLNLEVFRPTKITVRIPAAEADRLLSSVERYDKTTSSEKESVRPPRKTPVSKNPASK